MACIAIFCDGTWNSPGARTTTHVVRLAQACAESRQQKVLYFAGVGTGTGMVSDLGRWLCKLGGGLFGWGLNRNIKAAYLELSRLYQPGDKIMIFGFSRGAYTTRSLAGMIRKCGILSNPSPSRVDHAFRLYRTRGVRNAPDSERIWAARRELSPDFATSPADVIRRNDHSYLVRITYLGIWDTVGALGIPRSMLGSVAQLWNARYEFHDTRLSRLVEAARHAVALDEKRVLFEPSLWDNLEPREDDPGLNHGDQSDQRPYQQLWFAGDHGIVGGSGVPAGLAAASLSWIWEGAALCGLKLTSDQIAADWRVDALAPAPQMGVAPSFYRFFPWLMQWRCGPSLPHDLHGTARLRAAVLPGYRPQALARVLPGLFRDR